MQLAIVGEQSSGKSSLLQTLTDIPFPVGAGLCTRFATRIVSKRTAPNTTNKFKITIVEPEVTIKGLSYPEDTSYQGYVRVGENLGTEEFRAIMDEVCSLMSLFHIIERRTDTKTIGIHEIHGYPGRKRTRQEEFRHPGTSYRAVWANPLPLQHRRYPRDLLE